MELVIDTEKVVFRPNTYSSGLRTPSKSGGFRNISDWLSCVYIFK